MFNMLSPDMPPRGRNRLHRLQSLARRNPRAGIGSVDSMWMPMPDKRMLRGLFNEQAVANPFEEETDSSLPFRISPFDVSYSNPYSNKYSRDQRLSPVMAFDRAAAALKNALDAAIRFCREVEKDFYHETGSILPWADSHCIDYLWATKLGWNGVPAAEFARNRNQSPPPTVVTYNMVVKSLLRSVDDLQMSERLIPDMERSQQEPERVRTILKKLSITFQGIEELLDSVRRHRQRMASLQKELASARSLLGEIRDLWTSRGMGERRQTENNDFIRER